MVAAIPPTNRDLMDFMMNTPILVNPPWEAVLFLVLTLVIATQVMYWQSPLLACVHNPHNQRFTNRNARAVRVASPTAGVQPFK